jgi:hypothetical protein
MHGFRNEIGKTLVLYFKLTLVITFRPLTLTVFEMLFPGPFGLTCPVFRLVEVEPLLYSRHLRHSYLRSSATLVGPLS